MEKQVLDYMLVPTGLLLMVAYHIWLFYQVVKHPSTTVIGINAVNRRFWVRAMMEVYKLLIQKMSMKENKRCCEFEPFVSFLRHFHISSIMHHHNTPLLYTQNKYGQETPFSGY